MAFADPARGSLSAGETRQEEGAGDIETDRRNGSVTKRTSAKYKIDRRMGENIWGRP